MRENEKLEKDNVVKKDEAENKVKNISSGIKEAGEYEEELARLQHELENQEENNRLLQEEFDKIKKQQIDNLTDEFSLDLK